MDSGKATSAPHSTRPSLTEMDFDRAPFIIFWEITRACSLACIHCRAEAQPKRHPNELSTAEGLSLIDQMAEFGNPVLVITGGDPLMRRDVFQFIQYGIRRGLRVSLSPSATKLVTPEKLHKLKEAGLSRISFSLDGSCPQIHDAFRGVQGSFQRTLQCVRGVKEAGLSLQINTTVSRHNLSDLEAMGETVLCLGAVLWDLFFLVPTGRGQMDDVISPEDHERVSHWISDYAKTAPFDVKATLGQHYRRVFIQRRQAEEAHSKGGWSLNAPGFSITDGIGWTAKGTNDGNGVCFISHVGEIYPSGFLPLKAGNVRRESLVDIYRSSPLFLELRDPSKLKGKCGRCEFKTVCGGSRARAYAVTGDYMAQEPYCIYQTKPAE